MIRLIYLVLIYSFVGSLESKHSNDGQAQFEHESFHRELRSAPGLLNSIDDSILRALKKLSERIPHGMEELGIPVLDPYQIKTLNFDKNIVGVIKANGELKNLTVTGFKNIQIHNASLQLLGLYFNFDFQIPQAIIEGLYKVNGRMGLILPFSSSGDLRAEINDIRISGSTKISVKNTDKTLYLQYLNITIANGESKVSLNPNYGGVIIKKIMNMLMNRLTPAILDKEKRKIEAELSQSLTLKANKKLEKHTLSSLIKAIKQGN